MELTARLNAFINLGKFLNDFVYNNKSEELNEFSRKYFTLLNREIENSFFHNKWFTKDFLHKSIEGLNIYLNKEKLESWLKKYSINDQMSSKKIAIIMAGNIPLVGFHDMLTVLISGNIFIGKQSSKDSKLLNIIGEILIDIEPKFNEYIYFTDENLKQFDAVIATGSNNTSRYFEYYFGKYPNIIRKNRNSVAILKGDESKDELERLADDVFMYFGLGCRNVSKLFVPHNYNFDYLINTFEKYRNFINHSGFMNNFDYNNTIYLMSQIDFYNCGFFIITQNENIASPISVLYFEEYKDHKKLSEKLEMNNDQIQCIVSNQKDNSHVPFGMSQKPELWDYADGIDTLEFLLRL